MAAIRMGVCRGMRLHICNQRGENIQHMFSRVAHDQTSDKRNSSCRGYKIKATIRDNEGQMTMKDGGDICSGKLYVVSTPIGLELLFGSSTHYILAEDTRRTKRLLQAIASIWSSMSYDSTLFGQRTHAAGSNDYELTTRNGFVIDAKSAIRKLKSFHEHNATQKQSSVISDIQDGMNVVLVSDAGTPLISDPGTELVRACVQWGVQVVPVPGPSAPLAALVGSGIQAVPYTFIGFLPTHGSARRKRISTFRDIPSTLIIFVPPHDLQSTLSDLELELGPTRCLCIARELTKEHEELWRGTITSAKQEIERHNDLFDEHGSGKIADKLQKRFRGEICLVIEPNNEADAELLPSDNELYWHIRTLLIGKGQLTNKTTDAEDRGGMSIKDIVDHVVTELGVRKKKAYKMALEIQAEINRKEDQCR